MAEQIDKQVQLVRDAVLEAYVRRNPMAEPKPGTSLYAVLEAFAIVAAPLFQQNPEAESSLYDLLEADRAELIQPDATPSAFLALETREGDPNPKREADDWPCQRKAEGSF